MKISHNRGTLVERPQGPYPSNIWENNNSHNISIGSVPGFLKIQELNLTSNSCFELVYKVHKCQFNPSFFNRPLSLSFQSLFLLEITKNIAYLFLKISPFLDISDNHWPCLNPTIRKRLKPKLLVDHPRKPNNRKMPESPRPR